MDYLSEANDTSQYNQYQQDNDYNEDGWQYGQEEEEVEGNYRYQQENEENYNEEQGENEEEEENYGDYKEPSELKKNNSSSINQSGEFIQEIRKWQWANPLIEGVPPCPRGGHTATLTGASIIVFGGHYYAGKSKGYVYLNDTYILDVNANRWIKPKISGTPPAPRYSHTAVLAGSRIIIFGGKGEKDKVFRDLHALDPVTMTWYQGPEGSGSPSARLGHSANLFGSSKMIIFGGWNGTEFFNDVYILDLEIMAWTQPDCTGPAPCPRYGHAAIQVGSNLMIQGGFCFDEGKQRAAGFKQGTQLKSCYLNDLRVLDTDSFTWSRLRISGNPPLPRYGHSATISGSDIVIFGGWSLKSGNRDEAENKKHKEIEYFLVLNTEYMVWEKGRYVGSAPLSRYGHTATAIGPHTLIFGGWEFSRATNEVVVMRDITVNKNAKSK